MNRQTIGLARGRGLARSIGLDWTQLTYMPLEDHLAQLEAEKQDAKSIAKLVEEMIAESVRDAYMRPPDSLNSEEARRFLRDSSGPWQQSRLAWLSLVHSKGDGVAFDRLLQSRLDELEAAIKRHRRRRYYKRDVLAK